ncbi:MAG: hypothetical protein AAFX55_12740 [Bacteroidota bacterium]
MFKNVPYKKKFLFIILGFVVLLLAAYKKNFKSIFEIRSQLSHIDKKLNTVDGSYQQIFFLKNEIAQLNDLIGGQTKDPELVQELILDFVTNTNLDINIHDIEDTHVFSDDEFTIYTNVLQIEGDYNTLLKLLYTIEKDFLASKVVSSEFYTEKNYRTTSKKLFLKLILQNYEKNN